MKIAVITPYDSSNYGAYLQAYCLKYQLEKMGHEVIHIPTRNAEYVRKLYYRDKPVSKRDKLMPWVFQRKNDFGKRKYSLFKTDIEETYIAKGKNVEAELYILGSDEIWNVNQSVFRDPIFWGGGLSPVISYAASIGSADIDSFEKYPEQVNAVRKMKSILVRDKRTKQFVKQFTDLDAELVCDPTMLIPIEEYGKELKDDFVAKNDCLLVYAYRINKKLQQSIQNYAKKRGLKTVSCCFWHDWCDYQCECSPLQFSSLIRQCKGVVTTTFHGSIFSILNHTRFVNIPASPKSNQLMEQLGLEKRLLPEQMVCAETLEAVLEKDIIDFGKVDSKIKKMRETSVACLEKAIQTASSGELPFDYQICSADDCTGCFACMNKCPKNAISCVTDSQGRTLPQIDPAVCVKCGLCKKVCPQINPLELEHPSACYAAQRIDEDLRKGSASGGIGAVLAEKFIESGGVAYGAAVMEGGGVVHTRADSLEEAKKFRGSKYVQSYIGNSYQDVLEQLKLGKKILFIGTPCQIAGLKKYLEVDYDGLYCVDLICHGIPPMQYLKEHIETMLGNQAVETFSFRGGEKDFVLNITADGKLQYSKDKIHDVYYHGFLKRLIYRENCYTCAYATSFRVSDMTIGDFWGVKRADLKEKMSGNISVILLNSHKGEELFSNIQREIVSEERKIEEAVSGNPQLRNPALKHRCREKFLAAYQKNQRFEKAILETDILKEMKILQFKKSLPGRALIRLKHLVSRKENV